MKHVIVMLLTATLLSSCGGGGSDPGLPQPVVTSYGTTPGVKYADSMVITLNGTNLDQTLSFSTNICKNYTRLNSGSTVSTASTAYFSCTVSGIGTQNITVAANSSTIATIPLTVATPEVTFTISNGAAVTGSLVMQLRPDLAPIAVDNFLSYVRTGWYNGVVIHRYSPGFVLQGGGYTSPLTPSLNQPATKPANAAITLEDNTTLSNVQWSVAMARTSVADSATTQFFINLANNSGFLDRSGTNRGYAVFGTVTSASQAFVTAMTGAPCTAFPALLSSGECMPSPNLVITGSAQTR